MSISCPAERLNAPPIQLLSLFTDCTVGSQASSACSLSAYIILLMLSLPLTLAPSFVFFFIICCHFQCLSQRVSHVGFACLASYFTFPFTLDPFTLFHNMYSLSPRICVAQHERHAHYAVQAKPSCASRQLFAALWQIASRGLTISFCVPLSHYPTILLYLCRVQLLAAFR